MTKQERFDTMQARWRKAQEAERWFSHALTYKYGNWWQAPSAKRDRMESLRRRTEAAADAIFAWLDSNSPRQWRAGVPAHWVCDSLTYADAITAGRMSVTPPPSYGSYPSDALRFAQPIEPRCNPLLDSVMQ